MLSFSFLLVWNTLIVSASNTVKELPELVVEAKQPQKPLFKPEDLKPKVPTNQEMQDRLKEIIKKNGTELPEPCKGIKLNTDFPFIWRCIGLSSTAEGANQTNAFAYMVKAIMKFIITIIMVVSVLMIVAAGVLMTTEGYEKGSYTKGMGMIKTVAQALALLGASGVILKLINPNFFT